MEMKALTIMLCRGDIPTECGDCPFSKPIGEFYKCSMLNITTPKPQCTLRDWQTEALNELPKTIQNKLKENKC